jgi:hypothetical protein
VHNPTPRGHPLDVPGGDLTPVSQTVLVFHIPVENVGDGLDSTMGMPGEPGFVLGGIFIAEIVEEQEGIDQMRILESKSAAEMDAGSFDGRTTLPYLLDPSNRGVFGHVRIP